MTGQRDIRREDEIRWRTPLADIHEDQNAFYVNMDVPGVDEQHLEILFENGTLTIKGETNDLNFEGYKKGYHEFRMRPFKRTFTVSEHINSEGITAALGRGILKLTLPKSETIKPRKIAVTGG
jgi:HSP20 family protein